jgi:BlaI family penicillinase repressor
VDGTLGDRELEVMSALWEDGPGTVAEVQDRLGVDLAYNTVLTILRNLEQKGFVRHQPEGRLHRYFPEIAKDAVRGSLLSRLVDKVFGGSSIGLITQLVEGDDLSQEDLRDLHRLLDARLAARASTKSKSSRVHRVADREETTRVRAAENKRRRRTR